MTANAHRQRLRILGRLRVWRDDIELDLGAPQQARLFAHLLARAGDPVSTTTLVAALWGEDVPASALNIIHKYVGALRRLLEPELPPRGTGSCLLRRGDAYLFVTGPAELDLARFRDLVARAGTERSRRSRPRALELYLRALDLWQGPAGENFPDDGVARSPFARLDDEFFTACVIAAELAVELGRPVSALPHLQRAAAMAPLHEGVQAGLITTLAAAGSETEALASFDSVRDRLADNLGIDPGSALQSAQQRAVRPRAAGAGGSRRRVGSDLVGRTEELAALRRTAEAAFAGTAELAVVQGEPGIGKTRLMHEVAAEAERRGALVVRGHCLSGAGAPSMWPWAEVLTALLENLPDRERDGWRGRELSGLVVPRDDLPAAPVRPDNGFRFRLFEQVVEIVAQTAARRPVVIVLDDLHWADTASLHLLSHLADRLPGGAAIIAGARDRAPAPGPELSRMLAVTSRSSGHRRISLDNLDPGQVAELVSREIGSRLTAEAVRDIHRRTAGNPFFTLELARLLTHKPVAGTDVPSTVRDVVIDRTAGLDDDTRDLLRVAALAGREVDLRLLSAAMDLDLDRCLGQLEPVVALGLLEAGPHPSSPLRFEHDLVREALTAVIPPALAARLHLAIAEALQRLGPDDEQVAEALAHHLWSAGPLAEPKLTAAALLRAGRLAAGRSALETAETRLRSSAPVNAWPAAGRR